MKKYALIRILLIAAIGSWPSSTQALEPVMASYTNFPLFTANQAKPNILIIQDNSGSMNENAYGSAVASGGTVTDEPYAGAPYTPAIDIRTAASCNDAEQNLSTGAAWCSNGAPNDLDLGRFDVGGQQSLIGLRFSNVQIPAGSTIVSAYIEFKALDTLGGAMTIEIAGENVDSAAVFSATANDISNRSKTANVVNWALSDWTANTTYQSPDIKAVVQEIVNRTGWLNANEMAFIITGNSSNNKRTAYSHDNTAANAPLLHIVYTQAPNTKYYGYFNPDWFYTSASNKFSHAYLKIGYNTATCANSWETRSKATVDGGGTATQCLTDANIVSNGLWDGNWMNWATMRKIDVARKVIMGGKATSRTGGGNQVLQAETISGRSFVRHFNSTTAVTPYDGDYWYGMDGNYIYVDDDSNVFSSQLARYTLDVQKELAYEPNDFVDGNLAGVLQKVGDQAWWGDEFFNTGTGNNQSGGRVAHSIGTNMTTLITDLQNTPADTWTPLAEAYYVAMQYFKQVAPEAGLDYPNGTIGAINNTNDPYYQQNNAFTPCAKSFVILLTDGASTKDAKIPAFLKTAAAYGDSPADKTACNESTGTDCDYPSGGTDFLDNVALYARTHDLRADLAGNQNLILYPIYAFGRNEDARNLLRSAAKNGGFEDLNGNGVPDLQQEWDKKNNVTGAQSPDGMPDTYFEASNGYLLETQLLAAINDILKRAGSGTAVSVLATSSEGEGSLVQAYFQPLISQGSVDTKWTGYLQALWVDSMGNLRENTNGVDSHGAATGNLALDLTVDKLIKYIVDPGTGAVTINRYDVSASDPYPDINTATPSATNIPVGEIIPIWEAGKVLSSTSPSTRNIFTNIPSTAAGDALFGGTKFHNDTNALRDFIKPYLGVKDNAAWSYMGATHDQRAKNLIHFIRGNDTGFDGVNAIRQRTINGSAWPLGDIVESTPVTIATPPDNYNLVYSDKSYDEFYQYHKNRASLENVIYVGANDGMLHAFTSWHYDNTTKGYTKPAGAGATEQIGAELWAYIPQALLPHLKWLASNDYTHVSYVDLTPKIFDAKIFSGVVDDYHKNGWGTVLVGGLNMGGKPISVTDDFDHDAGTADTSKTFSSSYFAIDISNPRSPRLLWEKTYTDLNLTTGTPTLLKTGDKWFLTFGSGPTGYDGTSTTKAHLFVVDLATGVPYQNGANDWLFEAAENTAFLAGPVSYDFAMNFNTDAAYVGETYKSGANWLGAMYKVTVPWYCTASNADCTAVVDGKLRIPYGTLKNEFGITVGKYVDNPNDASRPWTFHKIFDSPKPITAPAALSIDAFDNTWIYFGTGRFLGVADKTTIDTQYLFGIKDPFFNKRMYDSNELDTYVGSPNDYYANYNTRRIPLTTGDSITTTRVVQPAATCTNPTDLFDADSVKVILPWGCPTGGGTCGYFSCKDGVANGCDDVNFTNMDTAHNTVLNFPNIQGDGSCLCTISAKPDAMVVDNSGNNQKTFAEMLAEARCHDGWKRTMTPGERAVTKPAVMGGLALFTAYTPSSDVCGFGGNSSLYALYYESGTAYKHTIFREGTESVSGLNTVRYKLSLGAGKASSVGIHVGKNAEGKVTGFVQQSTGAIEQIELGPALNLRSGFISWQEN
ncbi:MAG: PilC/PilY family type IV pilus protein [Desulfurivibrionaceae bacterium]|jgi:type IV pilus assembly protein PilY1